MTTMLEQLVGSTIGKHIMIQAPQLDTIVNNCSAPLKTIVKRNFTLHFSLCLT